MGDILRPVIDLMPPQIWKDMHPREMVGIPRIFKVSLAHAAKSIMLTDVQIAALEHPKGDDAKTQDLLGRMSKADLEVLPIDTAKLPLKAWHAEKGRKLRLKILKQRDANHGLTAARL